ncbi:MAG: tetratricopeptide repeat protein [Ignavibacteria bacterium]|nr:MAG: tetratricopeptide repeat protein [Ignavibacteria bacterium]
MLGQTISHYKILEKLGEGGMGVVYKAQDLRLNRLVALKFLPAGLIGSKDDIARFDQEARAISALNHPNIATIYDVDEADGQKYLVLEYIPSGTLKARLKELRTSGKELRLSEVVDFGIQIAEGLAHAHREGIVHRDVKTDNVILTKEGKIKITDFGLAKLAGEGKQLTKAGSTIGTAAYMSPEQIRAEEVDSQSDLFSYGVVLYELTTGHLPFRGEHEAALSYSIVNENPTPIKSLRPDTPAELERCILRCLEKDKSKRYRHAEEILSDLKSIQQTLSGPVPIVPKRSALRWIAAGLAAALVLAGLYVFLPTRSESVDRKSIAVIPFKNFNEDKENEFFSDGITEDIITQLSKIGDLKVIARTSVVRYKNSDKDLREIGKELGVATILEGSVRRADNHIRIVGQLIDTRTNEHIWADTYDRDMKDVFEIQSDVAQKIAAALQAKLSASEKAQIEKKPTGNVDAYGYHLKGREYYYRYHKQDNDNAIELFKKALSLDPNYALAYAGLGDCYGQRAIKFGYPTDWADSAVAASEKAIACDPNSAEGYKALGLAYAAKGLSRRALEAYQKSVSLNPNYHPAVGNCAFTYLYLGDLVEAVRWAKKDYALSAIEPFSNLLLGAVYMGLTDDARAENWYQKTLDLQPDFIYPRVALSEMYLEQGDDKDAIDLALKGLELEPGNVTSLNMAGTAALFAGNYPGAKDYFERAYHVSRQIADFTIRSNGAGFGFALMKLGQPSESNRLFRETLALRSEEVKQGNELPLTFYDIASIHAALGEKEEAYTWLSKSIDGGWRDYRYTMRDPMMENLRGEKKFAQMMADLKSMVGEMKKKVEDAEKP